MNKLTLFKKYENEMNTLHFKSFTCETALAIGNDIINTAKHNGFKVTIDISKFNHQLFHYAFDGTTPDKDLWIVRKKNVALHFNTSSILMATKLEIDGTTLSEKYGLPTDQYAAAGGSVPIIIKNAGVIGAITIAGLKPEEDHNLVINAIKKYVNSFGKCQT